MSGVSTNETKSAYLREEDFWFIVADQKERR